MSQLRVFLSHSSQDKAFADVLVRALRQAGADVWYDEHSLGAGHLVDEIQRELVARPVFVIVLSKAAFASEWVRREAKWAWNLEQREPQRLLLPVVAGAIEPSDFNPVLYLEDYRRVEGPGHQPYPPAEAVARALRLLGLTPAGAALAPAAPQPSESAADLVTRGQALAAQKQLSEALVCFERAAELEPDNDSAWFMLGYTHSELHHFEEALAANERALALNPAHAKTWSNKGYVLRNLQRYEEALAAYKRALALAPELAGAWTGKGSALEGLSRYEEALAAYNRAFALDPHLSKAYTDKVNALRALVPNGKGRNAGARAMLLPHESIDDLLARGRELAKRWQRAEAVWLFERATQLAPDNFDTWFSLGYTLTTPGAYDKALAAFDRALALAPDNAAAWNNIAAVHNAIENYDKALVACGRALDSDPGLAVAWINRGDALIGLDRSEEALVAYDRALVLNPDVASWLANAWLAAAWLGKAAALRGLQRTKQSLAAIERAASLDKGYASASKTIKRYWWPLITYVPKALLPLPEPMRN